MCWQLSTNQNEFYSRDLFAWQVTKWGRQPTLFKFIEAVHNCPAVWDVSSLAYKDTNKNKQNKTEERADKLGFVQTFLFLHRFLFLLFFSSVSLLYVSATTVKKWPCCKLPCLLFDTSLTCEGKSLSTFRSFPTRVCQLKFALWRPLSYGYRFRKAPFSGAPNEKLRWNISSGESTRSKTFG